MQAAAEEQLSQAKTEAAIRFHDLYVKHASWKAWLLVVQQGRARQQLEQQHAARQRGIQRFLQVTHPACLNLGRDIQSC